MVKYNGVEGQYTCGAKYICFLPKDGDDNSYIRLAQCPDYRLDRLDTEEWTTFADMVVALLNKEIEK